MDHDLTPLEGLTALTVLSLGSNQLGDLAPLAGLTALTSLDLVQNRISNLAPLEGLTALTVLSLGSNQLGDLAPLAGLTALTSLDLFHNQISSLVPLERLTALTVLSLGNNQLGDLAPLAGLTTLTSLDLFHNQISNLAPLEGLSGLAHLDLYGNPIIDLAPLEGLTVFTTTRYGRPELLYWSESYRNAVTPSGVWSQVTGLVEAGDVLEQDPNLRQAYRATQAACSDLVAGVAFTQTRTSHEAGPPPGPQALVAFSGIAPVKVTDEGGSIQKGDTLVSSSTPSYAKRWAGEVLDCPCAQVGIALEPMTDERGIILTILPWTAWLDSAFPQQ